MNTNTQSPPVHYSFETLKKVGAFLGENNLIKVVDKILEGAGVTFKTPNKRLIELFTDKFYDVSRFNKSHNNEYKKRFPDVNDKDNASQESADYKEFTKILNTYCTAHYFNGVSLIKIKFYEYIDDKMTFIIKEDESNFIPVSKKAAKKINTEVPVWPSIRKIVQPAPETSSTSVTQLATAPANVTVSSTSETSVTPVTQSATATANVDENVIHSANVPVVETLETPVSQSANVVENVEHVDVEVLPVSENDEQYEDYEPEINYNLVPSVDNMHTVSSIYFTSYCGNAFGINFQNNDEKTDVIKSAMRMCISLSKNKSNIQHYPLPVDFYIFVANMFGIDKETIVEVMTKFVIDNEYKPMN